uniref:Uncharacterized protein n=1 Tax=Oryza meridionalis TaxID=40149 RepID=A0A0E0E242_9ORYZ
MPPAPPLIASIEVATFRRIHRCRLPSSPVQVQLPSLAPALPPFLPRCQLLLPSSTTAEDLSDEGAHWVEME